MVNNTRLVSDSSTLKQITIHTNTAIGQRRNKNRAHERVSRAVKPKNRRNDSKPL